MNTKKLGFIYLPILAILLTISAIIIDLSYDRPVRWSAVVLLVLMSAILFVGLKNRDLTN
ncbi:MAG: hypothetical protein ACI9DJ_000289 [Algoriphagus sp.]|jgi:hypothetical protein